MDKYSKEELTKLICEVAGLEQLTPLISKQIHKMVVENQMSYKEIARCIVYYVDICGGKFTPAYGIAAILNFRQMAAQYFTQLELDKQRQREEAEKILSFQDTNTIILNIDKIDTTSKRPNKISLDDIDFEGDN